MTSFEWFVIAGVVMAALSVLFIVTVVAKRQNAADVSDDFFSDGNKGARIPRKALIVGINNYPQSSKLGGCLNDVADMLTRVLSPSWKLPVSVSYAPKSGTVISSDGTAIVKILVEKDATSANVKRGLAWLAQDAKAGDVRLFQYSGHGTQTPNAAEADGYDEAIWLWDSRWEKPTTWFTDDNFAALKVPDGVDFTLFLDSCHSGDSLRSAKAPARCEPPRFPQRVRRVEKKRDETDAGNVVLISGCRSDQTSMDANFGGRKNGLLTYSFLRALAKDKLASLTRTLELTREEIKAQGYTPNDQDPQLQGSERLKQKPFLG